MTMLRRAMMNFTFTVTFAAVLWWIPSGLSAQQTPAVDVESGMTNSSIALPQSVIQAKKSYSYYNSENRDPFESLIMEKMEAQPGEEPKDPREMYDIEVMKVVAVVHTEEDGKGFASVLLPDGKYYTLVKGMKVGIHGGHVDEIQRDRVIVKQEVLDFRRQVVEQTRELKLREEEDQ